MIEQNMLEVVQAFGLKRILSYLDSDPEKNIFRVVDWLSKSQKFDPHIVQEAKLVKKTLEEGNSNWFQLMKSLWTDVDSGVRRKMFENFLINATAIGEKRQNKAKEKHGCNIPWAILLDPTSACNLNCIGCWASEYG
ncbi:MAG: radical SAM protein, partial [Bacteroidales bacterium]|nr:radical SAM protein [Bacteroidales bacterium]